ncbi:MAG: hypothetical protein IK066_12015, partial [Kiritimatiellae bacterium]|nr:hypothetical protein [Kiritimatiellia bacterium]
MAVKAYGADFSGGRILLAKAERGRVETFAGHAARAALERARTEVEAGRAALAVAAPAPATMMRELHTPLASATAARVWESLLDLALPVPVEQTVWAVAGERADAGGGRRAMAYALGRKDLEEAEAAWAEWGIVPTHEDAFPEALWAAAGRAERRDEWRVAVWLGEEWAAAVGGCRGEARTWHVLRTPPRAGAAFAERFAARAGAFLDLARGPEVLWGGPGAEDGELVERLEEAVRANGAKVRFGHIAGGGNALAEALARRAAEGTAVGLKAGMRAHPAWA